jgi:hypothetical protein
MASGHMNRVKRPDTWLHRPMLQNVKKVLANPEPSTHDPFRTSAGSKSRSAAVACHIVMCYRYLGGSAPRRASVQTGSYVTAQSPWRCRASA